MVEIHMVEIHETLVRTLLTLLLCVFRYWGFYFFFWSEGTEKGYLIGLSGKKVEKYFSFTAGQRSQLINKEVCCIFKRH